VADPGEGGPVAEVWHRDGKVYVGFGEGLPCIWMLTSQARMFAKVLTRRADLADEEGSRRGTAMASEPERKQ